jgi:chaperonin GroES
MNIKPIGDRVVIIPFKPEESTIGGIIIPDTDIFKGRVTAVGNGTKDEEMFIKPGDCVLYGRHAGTEFEFEGTKYLIMCQSTVLAIVE